MRKVKIWIHKNQIAVFLLVLFIFLFYLSFTVYKKESLWPIERFCKDVVLSIQNIVTPKYQVNYQSVIDTFTKDKEEELQSLRKLLDLTNNSSFSLEHASIINRNASYYFDEITINKGKEQGIDVDMLAITEEGLVGKVKYVTKNTAVIKLLTAQDNSFKVSVSIMSGNNIYHGIITGYNEKEECILVTSVRGQSEIEVGSQVITNGLGNLYPKGIEVGKVSSIEMDSVGVNKILKIESKVDFKNLKYVSIIKGVKE